MTGRARRVLAVDDEPTIAASVAARLRAEGFTVDDADDGPSARCCDDRAVQDSLLRELAGDRRLIMVLPGSMVMQVAHPVVGAGVGAHSVFRTDPWGRLAHSLDSTLTLARGGPAATAEGARLRALHREIRGVDDRGRRYSALHPEAYAWVHLTLFERLVTMSRLFGPPVDRAGLYAEFLELGDAMGIRRHHLPADEPAVWPHLARMTAEVLENHPTVHAFLHVLRTSPVPPPRWPSALRWAWPAVGRPFGEVAHFLAVGTLDPALRERLGLRWSDRQEKVLARMADGVRRGAPRLPASWRRW